MLNRRNSMAQSSQTKGQLLQKQKYQVQSSLVGVHVLASIVAILLHTYLLNFLLRLEGTGCACAMDWRRKYIVGFVLFMIVFNIASALAVSSRKFARARMILSPVIMVASILFVVFTFQYVSKLEREKCKCSDDTARLVLLLVAAVNSSVFAILGLTLLVLAITVLLGSADM